MYKYYSTQRPIDPGTFPQPEGNPPLEVINYDESLPVSGEVFRAWGELTYQEPLSKADADAYELRPSRHNRDVREDVDRMAQTVGAWEKRQRVPDSKRLTWWYPDFGCYVAKEYVTPEQLAQRYQLAANWPERQKKKSTPGKAR